MRHACSYSGKWYELYEGISSNSSDGRGNYNLGSKEQVSFPENDYDKVDIIRGMDIAIISNCQTDAEGFFYVSNVRYAISVKIILETRTFELIFYLLYVAKFGLSVV